jgi:hypothetical protein
VNQRMLATRIVEKGEVKEYCQYCIAPAKVMYLNDSPEPILLMEYSAVGHGETRKAVP